MLVLFYIGVALLGGYHKIRLCHEDLQLVRFEDVFGHIVIIFGFPLAYCIFVNVALHIKSRQSESTKPNVQVYLLQVQQSYPMEGTFLADIYDKS